jgi:hypothetical protein
MSALAEARCARCGAAFGCCAAAGSCWCGAIEVPAAVQARLVAAYEGCLCPDCLRAEAAAAEP